VDVYMQRVLIESTAGQGPTRWKGAGPRREERRAPPNPV